MKLVTFFCPHSSLPKLPFLYFFSFHAPKCDSLLLSVSVCNLQLSLYLSLVSLYLKRLRLTMTSFNVFYQFMSHFIMLLLPPTHFHAQILLVPAAKYEVSPEPLRRHICPPHVAENLSLSGAGEFYLAGILNCVDDIFTVIDTCCSS